jgi:hypothetical protein
MIIFYRYSDGGYAKQKLEIATKKVCLLNFLQCFGNKNNLIYLIADNIKDETLNNDLQGLPKGIDFFDRQECGSSAASFKYVFEKVLSMNLNNEDVVYFVEDDYLHTLEAPQLIVEGLEHFHFVTLYDHPDKYNGNPLVSDGGEVTRVVRGATQHWKYTNSTTMTFATTFGTLKQSKDIIFKHIQGTYPTDFQMFLDLREAGFSLGLPLPGASTHIETAWLAPHKDWEYVARETIAKEQIRKQFHE